MRNIIKTLLILCAYLAVGHVHGQTLNGKLNAAFATYNKDAQNKYGITGFVVEEIDGNVVYSYNAHTGLAPASAQKVVTAVTALDVFGPQYNYLTSVSHSGSINAGTLNGDLLIEGSGDPTLASWRYGSKPEEGFFEQVLQSLRAKAIQQINGNLVATNTRWSVQPIPGGWIYDDMGNYYGAGSWALNYHENQYDVHYMATGSPGRVLKQSGQVPSSGIVEWDDLMTLGNAGTGDRGYIYAPPYSTYAYTNGSLGKTDRNFPISGSMPHGEWSLLDALKTYLVKNGIAVNGGPVPALEIISGREKLPVVAETLMRHQSIGMDSIVYWFLRRSINLYGEALLKSMAEVKTGIGETAKGTDWVTQFWAGKGVPKESLRIQDGSGLSPQNRVTAQSLVQVMQYARKQSWYPVFYDGLPLIDGKKMKSGTIGGAKSYTGYLKDRNGKEYTFAIITNNYSGSPSALVQKMWKVLDVVVGHK